MARPKEYALKQVSFIKSDSEEMKLYKWLQRLPHGKFTELTKEYWMAEMRKSRNLPSTPIRGDEQE